MTLEKFMRLGVRSVFLVLLVGSGLAGCNTMEGFGKDVENAGESIEEQAD